MRKTLATLALCFGLVGNSFSGTVPEYREANPVSSITNRLETIKSSTSGKLELPLETIKEYIDNPVFSGKVILCLGESPYLVKSEPNVTVFYNPQGYTSRYEVVQSISDTNYLDITSRIYGNRFFGNFDSITFLTLKKNSENSVEYSNDMYISFENKFAGSFFKRLLDFPLLGAKLKSSFKKEQDSFVVSVKKTVENASRNPEEAIQRLRSYTNGPIYFSEGEINFFSNSMQRLNSRR